MKPNLPMTLEYYRGRETMRDRRHVPLEIRVKSRQIAGDLRLCIDDFLDDGNGRIRSHRADTEGHLRDSRGQPLEPFLEMLAARQFLNALILHLWGTLMPIPGLTELLYGGTFEVWCGTAIVIPAHLPPNVFLATRQRSRASAPQRGRT